MTRAVSDEEMDDLTRITTSLGTRVHAENFI